MMRVLKFFNSCSIVVIFFGIIVGLSLILDCFIPLTALIFAKVGYVGFWSTIFNVNFTLPMDVIVNAWAVLCAAYVGIDRSALTILTLNGEKGQMNIGNPEHIKQIIFQSFILYVIAVLLYLFFNVELQLSALFMAFASSVILFVGGNKAIKGVAGLAPEADYNKDGIPDVEQLNKKQIEYLGKIVNLMKNGKKFRVLIEKDRKLGEENVNK